MILLGVGSIMATALAAVVAVVGVVMYTTAEAQPDLDNDAYVPGEMVEIPNDYRWDGMVLWGTPADVDLSGVTCRVVFTEREEELAVGPEDVDEELAVHTDSAHGEVAYLASTATVLGQPSAATCEGDGLAQVFISADRDVEGSKGTARFALASSAFFLLFGLASGVGYLLLHRSR